MVESTKLELLADGAVDVRGAEALSAVSRSGLYALMAAGRLPWTQVGKKRLIPRRALVELLAKNVKGFAGESETGK
ncbi:MAG TPA: helix-turn-helix domain-containing protein [Urbifossiella sp.]|nr:helix-turn-helix domain-containing protein [Urbifossiella sp.]